MAQPLKNESLICTGNEDPNNMPSPFSEDDFMKIISAYKEIFPDKKPSDDLAKYFNFERKQQGREWSYICSNFYEIAKYPEEYYECIKKYDEELRKLIGKLKNSNDTADEIANKIKILINVNPDYKHFGSAIGICPYTDELLLKSINDDELPKKIVVVLAHDWYPIVSVNTEFSADEFVGALTKKALCDALCDLNPNAQSKTNTISWLNDVLNVADLYEKVTKCKSTQTPNERIKSLKCCYDKTKSEADLKKVLLKKLNRILLEEFYTETPKSAKINFVAPLEGYSIFNYYGKMIKLIPQKYTILFLNLYPDYREPGAETSGEIEGVTINDYKNFAKNVIDLIKAINSDFKVKCIITWGEIPFDYIKEYCSPVESRRLKDVISISEATLKVQINQEEISLIPSYHPSSRHYNNTTTYLKKIIANTLA